MEQRWERSQNCALFMKPGALGAVNLLNEGGQVLSAAEFSVGWRRVGGVVWPSSAHDCLGLPLVGRQWPTGTGSSRGGGRLAEVRRPAGGLTGPHVSYCCSCFGSIGISGAVFSARSSALNFRTTVPQQRLYWFCQSAMNMS